MSKPPSLSQIDTETRLLPPNASHTECELERVTARMASLPVPTGDLWNPKLCPENLLPWLAWSLSIDTWDSHWPESIKREVIEKSISVHRSKGTVAAVKLVLANAGFDEIEIAEGGLPDRYEGDKQHDGKHLYGGQGHWATYRVYLKKPISAAQARQVKEILSVVQPARSHLAGLYYTDAEYFYDSSYRYDGIATYGTA